MVINLITFASLLHKQASVRSSHEIILTELEKYFTVNFVDYQDISKLTSNDFSILFIATGGVERLVISHFVITSPPLPLYWQTDAEFTGCRSRSVFLATGTRDEKRDPSWRTARNHQTHFCITQQLHGATQPFWNAHRRDRHSVKLAHCQQCRLSACQTPLGSGIYRRFP